MATVWTKGSGFNAEYTSADYPDLTGWTGTATLYANGSSTARAAWNLVNAVNKMTLAVPSADIDNLSNGAYMLKALFTNSTLALSIGVNTPVSVVSNTALSGTMCAITMTIGKIDGTPTGSETRKLENTINGTTIVLGWDGVTVTASHPVADAVSGVIIGTESISTKTDAAGFAQLDVLQGQTVTVSCPSFGKSVTIDTTGLTTVDLSSYF